MPLEPVPVSEVPWAFMRSRSAAYDSFEYLAFRVLTTVMGFFSPRSGRWVSRVFGRAMMWYDSKHRRIAEKNLRLADPPVCPPEEIPKMIRRVYEHVALSVFELAHVSRKVRGADIDRHFVTKGGDRILQVLKDGRGAIMVVGHLGNWELAGFGLGLMGFPIHSLARPVKNPHIDRYVNRLHMSTGQKIISRFSAMRAMIETLRDRKILAILADQDNRETGLFPIFFGRPASTVRSPAVLALKYDVPLFPTEIYRSNGRQVIHFDEPIEPGELPEEEATVSAITQTVTRRLEQFIRRHPDQWMWLHKRWKTKPEKARRKL